LIRIVDILSILSVEGARFGIDTIPIEWLTAVRNGQRRANVYAEVQLNYGDALVEQLIADQ
jgi:hypothetical protein